MKKDNKKPSFLWFRLGSSAELERILNEGLAIHTSYLFILTPLSQISDPEALEDVLSSEDSDCNITGSPKVKL